ncbi:MAG: diacylglycerol kinase, partial [Rhodoferax sp.]|nr:diacylglycerol kinase [Rhodoferax sp.]
MLSATLDPAAPFFIVLNAGSGRDDATDTRTTIERVLTKANRAHSMYLVDKPDCLPDIARKAVTAARASGGVVVAAGGDGTINAVAQATYGSGCIFGVLPQGTFNYFSRTHGIPFDTAEAIQLLLTARAHPVQVGLV